MALAPRHIPITRDEMATWLKNSKRSNKGLEEYLTMKLTEKGVAGEKVDTRGHDSLDDETDLLQFILMDVASYGIL